MNMILNRQDAKVAKKGYFQSLRAMESEATARSPR
jgi:hypothetical protein